MEYKGKIENSVGDKIELDHNHDEQYLSRSGGQLAGPIVVDSIQDTAGNVMVSKGQDETHIGNDSQPTVIRGSVVQIKRTNGSQTSYEGVVSSESIVSIKMLTLAQFNALVTKDANTMYLIEG